MTTTYLLRLGVRAAGRTGRLLSACWASAAVAAVGGDVDWPTFQQNSQRNATLAVDVDPAALHRAWTFRAGGVPQPAWHGPAKWDAYADLPGLQSMRNYDPAYHVAAVGDAAYFGSSATDCVFCVDAKTGATRWTFFADGPVRIAPTFDQGKLYFGSDDGFAYCLDAATGELLWRMRPSRPDRRVVHNGRFIPLWPIRTGVAVRDGTAYFAASLLPWETSYLCAVDAATGKVTAPHHYVRELEGATLEGPMAVSSQLLIAPQGRVAPELYRLRDGKPLGALEGGGGSFVVLLDNGEALHGPGNKTGWINRSRAATREKVATHRDGRAVAVADGVTYLITHHALVALDYQQDDVLWRVPCEDPQALISVGDTLFVGLTDRVVAYSSRDGQELWRYPIDGRAMGLAFARNRLYVSSDTGTVDCFAIDPSQPPRPIAPSANALPTVADDEFADLKPVADDDDPRLLSRWVFQPPHLADFRAHPLAGALPAAIEGPQKLSRAGDRAALEFDGRETTATLAADFTQVLDQLPQDALTAEAWVRLDKAGAWDGILGVIHDDGDDEAGWLLGAADGKFCIAVAGREGHGRLTYLKAPDPATPGAWTHVAGTYDGEWLRLYVNGREVASSQEQRGAIRYPPSGTYVLGAYQDSNEHYLFRGAVHEVRAYRAALSAEDIAAHYAAQQDGWPAPLVAEPANPFRVAAGPWLSFPERGEAVVRWETERPVATRLEYRFAASADAASAPPAGAVVDPAPKTRHEARLTGLKHNRVYEYRLGVEAEGTTQFTPYYECDTFFYYPLPASRLATAAGVPSAGGAAPAPNSPEAEAATVLARARATEGICLLWGPEALKLAEPLAAISNLRIVGVLDDAAELTRRRNDLRTRDLYGKRITLWSPEVYRQAPPTSYAIDLAVCLDEAAPPELALQETLQLLTPGGTAIASFRAPTARDSALADATNLPSGTWSSLKLGDREFDCLTTGSLPGSGDWSHVYGRPDNSAFGGETLDGAAASEDFAVQWLGRPGPRYQADRNGRKTPPIAAGGRLLLQGLDRIVAVAAHNGVVLWSLEIPEFRRCNLPRDCGNWCADDQTAYAVIRDRCWLIDAARGEVRKFAHMPPLKPLPGVVDEGPREWGYVATADQLLLGTSAAEGASWTDFWGNVGWYDGEEGEVTYKVLGQQLFALDKQTLEPAWVYRQGVILHSTITVAGDRVYFVECRHPQAVQDRTGRYPGPEIWEQQYLTALDLHSGEVVWESPLDTEDGKIVFFMAHGADKLAIVSSHGGQYYVYGFADADGRRLWQAQFAWGKGKADHGTHLARPAIVGDQLFVRPVVLDLHTGQITNDRMPVGGCGTYACTTEALFFRSWSGGDFAMWNPETEEYTMWPRLRPDCWLSTIPASGMLLSPEGGGGCSCGKWMETSLGFIPKSRLQPVGSGAPSRSAN